MNEPIKYKLKPTNSIRAGKPEHIYKIEEKTGLIYISRKYGKGGWFVDPKTNELYLQTARQYWEYTPQRNLRDGRVRSWERLAKMTWQNYHSYNIPKYIWQGVLEKNGRSRHWTDNKKEAG